MIRIENPALVWGTRDQPQSTAFDDVYYSRNNGWDESAHVFLGGNDLPHRWYTQKQFTIAETGFGTGLNFLVTWRAFLDHATNGQRLDFITVEKYPLHIDDLARALQPWRNDKTAPLIDRLLAVYPLRTPGFHRRWLSETVTLTLIFDDAVRGFSQIDAPVDAWYLDGFAPRKNQALWHDDVYHHMARLSHGETTLASFTAARPVRDALTQHGFTVTRHKGHGYKKHRITGRFNGTPPTVYTPPKSVRIIGAGVAGAAMAHALQRRGVACTVIEQNNIAAGGASGNILGLVNPKIEAQDNPRNDLGLAAYSFAVHVLRDHAAHDRLQITQHGAVHLSTNDKREKLEKLAQHAGWLSPHLQIISAQDATDICGIRVSMGGVFYKDAMTVRTRDFVSYLLRDTHIQYGVTYSAQGDATPTILCAGWYLRTFPMLASIPLQPVRGQVIYVDAPRAMTLHCPVMFGSYIAPLDGQTWSMGATFDQNNDNATPHIDDDARILAAVNDVLGLGDLRVTDRWAQVRTATRDRFPVAGPVPQHENLYILGALGSHGLQFSLLLAEIIACMLCHAPLPVGRDAVKTVLPQRFWK